MGFFKNLFTNSSKSEAINTENTSNQGNLPPLPNVSSSTEDIVNADQNSEKDEKLNNEVISTTEKNEEQEERNQERNELSKKLKVSVDNFTDISNQFLSIFDTNPLLEVLKDDTRKMISDIRKLLKSTDSYIESLKVDETTDTDDINDIDDIDEWRVALDYTVKRESTITDIIERKTILFDLVSDALKDSMAVWWDHYRWLFIERKNSDIVLTKYGIIKMKNNMGADSPHIPEPLCTKYDFQSVIKLYNNYPFKFSDFHPIFKSIEDYISKGDKIDFHYTDKYADKQKSLDVFDEYSHNLSYFINHSITNTLCNYFAIITAFYCSVREYSEYGFIEMFNYDCLGNLVNLLKILHLPVISEVTIQKNNLISSDVLKDLNKNIVDFLKKIFNGAFFDKNMDFESNEQYKGLLKVQDINEHTFYNIEYGINGYSPVCPIIDSSNFTDMSSIIEMFSSKENFYMVNDLFGYILNIQQTISLSSQEKKKEDIQNGQDFENYVADLLIKLGYENVEVTKSSGDFGVDILAERDKIKYAIQCKYYSSPVGNKAVQEVFTGKTYYNANIGIVVTNNVFTPAAEEQAEASGVILWDKYDLEKFEQQTKQ